jgi:hypothetical protein
VVALAQADVVSYAAPVSPSVSESRNGARERPGADGPGLLEDLAARVADGQKRELELRRLVRSAHEQLARRDEEIARLCDRSSASAPVGMFTAALEAQRAGLEAERDRLAAECGRLGAVVAEQADRLDSMTRTRAWRLACFWWRLKDRVRVD